MNQNSDSNGNQEPVTTPKMESTTPPENNPKSLSDISVNVSKDLIAAAGFNVETAIVNALIGNITGTLPTKKSEVAEAVRCDICDCEISSNVILDFHINGSRHKKRLKALDIIAQLKAGNEKGIHVGDIDNPNAFRCEVCCLTVNSAQQLEFHLSGAKHKKKAAKAGLGEPESNDTVDNNDKIVNPPPKKKKKEEPKVLACDICNVVMNSQIQYDQHVTSKKHLLKQYPSNQYKRKHEIGEQNKRFPKFKSREGQYLNQKFVKPVSTPNFTFQNNCNQYNSENTNDRQFPFSIFNSNPKTDFVKSPYLENSDNFINNKGNQFNPPFKNFYNMQNNMKRDVF